MPHVYVSIGSNIEKEKNIHSAIQALSAVYGSLTLSSVYESEAHGFIGDKFYNLAVGFSTDETPEQLVAHLANIEQAHGRVHGGERFCARTLDLDLLLYDERILHDHGLDVPRQEISAYFFVLAPLAEIAPAQCHPETSETFGAMWARFTPKPSATRFRRIAFDFTATPE